MKLTPTTLLVVILAFGCIRGNAQDPLVRRSNGATRPTSVSPSRNDRPRLTPTTTADTTDLETSRVRNQIRSRQPSTMPPVPSKQPSTDRPSTTMPTTTSPPTNTNTTGGGASGWQADMLKAVNDERAKQGLKPLCLNIKLTKAANDHAVDMATNKYLEHTSKDGRSPPDRVKAAGFSNGAVAENIAQGQSSVSDVMKSWMGSSGHRANILGADYGMAGFGMSSNYWVQDFGGIDGEQCQS